MDQPNYGWGIQSLPRKEREETLLKVFEFLTLKERLTASLTCKEWYHLAFSPNFSKTMWVHFVEDGASFKDIRAYQNYRHACFCADAIDENQTPMADFLRAAPLESLTVVSKMESVKTLLDDYLPSMDELSELVVWVARDGTLTEDVLRINHPNLKSVTVWDLSDLATFEVDCRNMTDLNIISMTESESEKAVQLVIQLQQQLQSLTVYIHGNQQLEMLTNAKLGKLKKLELHISDISNGIDLFFDKMVNLVELQLHGENRHVRRQVLGEELNALKKLSKLKLDSMVIDTAGFEKSLRQMNELKDLNLWQCESVPSNQSSWHIPSGSVKNLTVDWDDHRPFMLPHCKKLKSLKFYIHSSSDKIDEIFVQICNSYPQLEKLHFDTTLWVEFRSSTSFSHIKQLKFLKELHLGGLFLDNVDWTTCSSMEIESLQLTRCEIDGNGLLQLLDLVVVGLDRLFLKRCNEIKWVITKEFVEKLRSLLPWCKISCEYGENDANAGDVEDEVEEPENIDMNLLQIN